MQLEAAQPTIANTRAVKSACDVQIVPGATRVYIEKEDLSLDVIKQHKVLVHGDAQKADILKQYILCNADKLGQMIVFVRTRRAADLLTQVCGLACKQHI
jgi:superfamily II DNA/RNA helicase